MNSRAIATQALAAVLCNKQSLTQILPQYKKLCKKPEDGAFVQVLCFGVLRFYPRLNLVASQLLKTPLKNKDQDILLLICVGLYQLIDLNTPPHAAISETVEASRQLKKPWASGLINAVLRNFLRQKETLMQSIEKNIEAKYQHPLWMIQAIKKAWPNDMEAILQANNHQAPMVLRVNLKKTTRESYLEKLATENMKASLVEGTEAGIILVTAYDVAKIPGFSLGLVSVQDGAAQLAANILDIAPNMRVLDACAAPGGKTAHILEKEPNLSELLAIDISEERGKRITENLDRLELNAKIITADAGQPNTWWDGVLFDRILLDAPCSATGVIRRHPDIKFLRQQTDIANLAKEQFALLKTLWALLKPGGRLLYATCSILPAENSEVVQQFLNQEPSARLLPMNIAWGEVLPVGHQLLPGQNHMDGFYYALLEKISK